MKTNRNVSLEKRLDSYQVEYEYVDEIAIKEIDIAKSLTNFARVEDAINIEAVGFFSVAWKRGDVFPPIVLWKVDDKSIVVLDGNHRIKVATEIGIPAYPFGAYIIKNITEAMARKIKSVMNTLNGMMATLADRVTHAIQRVELDGIDREEAATEAGIMRDALTKAIYAKESKNRAVATGIKGSGSLNPTSCVNLNQIKLAEPYKIAIETVIAGKLKGDAVAELAREIVRKKSEREQVEYAKQERNRYHTIIKETGAIPKRAEKGWANLSKVMSAILRIKKETVKALPYQLQKKLADKIDQDIEWLSELKRCINTK